MGSHGSAGDHQGALMPLLIFGIFCEDCPSPKFCIAKFVEFRSTENEEGHAPGPQLYRGCPSGSATKYHLHFLELLLTLYS